MNNSLVFYKRGRLAPGGVSTVAEIDKNVLIENGYLDIAKYLIENKIKIDTSNLHH